LFLDISATREKRSPNLQVLAEIANECFMPLGYGGGIQSLDQAKAVFDIGYEKIALNSAAIIDSDLVTQIASIYGSQAVIGSIDVKLNFSGQYRVYGKSGLQNSGFEPVAWARELESRGAGELLLTSIDREGTWAGFDLKLVKNVTDAVSIPVIAHGGAGNLEDIRAVIKESGGAAASLGSLVVFQKRGMGVLINFPDKGMLEKLLK
ncbi:MAG: HisA/HisF-related TIM barrel protein, partial [Candidatus Ranarchaeia archaeon]